MLFRVEVIFSLVQRGDLEALKRFTPVGFDWNTCGGIYGAPALHHAILSGFGHPSSCLLQVIEWLLQTGADPQQRAPSSSSKFFVWGEDMHSFKVAGHSALSLLLMLHEELSVFGSLVDHIRDGCIFLDQALSLISRTQRSSQREKVAVDPCLLDLWESVREMSATHNVTFVATDGEVTAHDLLLMAASPVLKAMLESSMKEGASKRVEVADATCSGVSLFLDLLYTHATRSEPDFTVMLAAIDLAHRWQVHSVVRLLAEALRNSITVQSFVPIAEAAVLKGLEALAKTCAEFGKKDDEVQAGRGRWVGVSWLTFRLHALAPYKS